MGIRVRKVIGYGFDDLNIEEGQYDLHHDTRFNPDGYFCTDWEDREKNFPMKDFQIQLQIMEANKTDWNSINFALLNQAIERGDFTDFQDLITWDPEFGLPNTCVFVPPGESQRWCQNDSQIDYYEETTRNRQQSHVLLIDRPLYPYESYVDLREDPPARVTGLQESLYRQAKYAPLNMDDTEMITNLRNLAATDMGFETWEELDKTIIPIVPPELVVALNYLKVFNTPSDVHRLKPMIYTFWS